VSKVVTGVLFLLLAVTLSFVSSGCNEKELTQEDIDQIVADAVTASTDETTTKFDMIMAMTTEFIGGNELGTMTIAADLTGAVDNTHKEMQMSMDMDMDIPNTGKQELKMELYIVDSWMYMKMDIPGIGEQWNKMELTDELWETQNQIYSQIALMETATEFKLLDNGNVDGTACYVMEIVPSMEVLGELRSQQTSGLEGIDWKELELFKEMSIKEWISKDSHQLMRQEVVILMEIRPEDIGAKTGDFGKMMIDLTMDMKLYDYSIPISIELPEAALEAMETQQS
jgi:hypothetical protein